MPAIIPNTSDLAGASLMAGSAEQSFQATHEFEDATDQVTSVVTNKFTELRSAWVTKERPRRPVSVQLSSNFQETKMSRNV